jgi:hypothetical protein
MSDGLAIPTAPDALTPAWLTDALRAGGVIGADTRVTAVSQESLGQGAGFIGQLARLTPTYEGPADGAPKTLIAKMPALDPGAREVAAMYGLYEREYRFYRELADQIAFRTARCYYSAGDAEKAQYILLLEDLGATGHAGDQVQGCTDDEARVVLRHLALHHAQWWGADRLDRVPWLDLGIDLVAGAMQQAYPLSWARAQELFGSLMPAEINDVLPGLGERLVTLMEPFRGASFETMAHGDFRLDNMFFGNAGSGYELAVLDWQSPSRSWGAYDISYFLYGNVDTATRRAHEMDWLREYHNTLVANGVTGYAFDDLMRDYRSSLLVSLGIFVVNGATLDPANERGKALFDLFFDRLSAAIMDLDALALLPAP